MGALGFGPSLRLYRHGRAPTAAGFDFTAGALPAGAHLTRPTAATRFNAAGVMVTEAADVARFDYDPATLLINGLLIEPARVNYALSSAAFDDLTIWNRKSVTVTANAAVAPDGTMAAELLAAGSNARQVQSITLPSSGNPCVASVYARLAGGAGGFGLAAVDTAGAPVLASSGFTSGGDWQRVSLPATTVPGTTILASIGNIGTFNSPDAIYGWGFQFEIVGIGERSGPSSYIATADAPASRAADALILDWASLGVADGAITTRFQFDDGTTQDVATTVAGGLASVPTNLSRAWLRRADKV